ncbi:MAG: DUF2892 domain-containing protein [Burkholderiales bacterium]|jgi:hypothetical protein|nr:DUF2892 domain-containing protein [Burkholderiales bacterium]
MQINMGTADRAVRFVVGVALLSLVFVLDGNLRWWGLIGLVPLLTSVSGRCPAYSIFGMSTCPVKGK